MSWMSVSEELISQISSNFSTTRQNHAPHAAALQRGVRPGTLDPGSVVMLKFWINPVVVAFTLAASVVLCHESFSTAYAALMLVASLLTAQVVRPPNLDKWIADPQSAHKSVLRTLSEWCTVVAILVAISVAMHIEEL